MVFLYVALIFILPANKVAMSNYNLDAPTYHVLLLLVVGPYMLIWLGAFYAYVKLQQYTTLLKKTPEGEDFHHITKGVMYLAYGLPLVALLSIFVNSIANSHPDFKAASIIIINYASLLVPLLAYSTIRKGSHGLAERAKIRFSLSDMRTVVMVLVLLGVAYCYFTFKKLNLDSIGSAENPYYLPAWLMITTVIIPYLYAWFSGLLAAYEMVLFSRQVQGVLYRQAMRWLASGLVGVIAGGVGLQYLHTVVPRTGHLSLSSTLLLVNIIFLTLAIGFILLIIGAVRVKKIEEV
jgi:hypothetical protein